VKGRDHGDLQRPRAHTLERSRLQRCGRRQRTRARGFAKARPAVSGALSLAVRVAHGDLRRTRFPVAVGHYAGDVIVNAEASLDAALGGALRQHFAVGRYPGEEGTAEILLQSQCNPPGAIVVGLGNVGDLTTLRLRTLLSGALKSYALRCLQTSPPEIRRPVAANFSTVLIGTDGGAFGSIPDSVHTIVRAAVDANRALREAGVSNEVQIREVEFIELYEDIAIRAAQAVAAFPGPLARELRADEAVVGAPTMTTYQGGRFLRPSNPYAAGWWQRIAVRRKPDAAAAPQGSDGSSALLFSVLTDRARVEQDVSVSQRTLIQQLITRATKQPEVDLAGSAALYQLLIPEQVKDRIRTGGNLLFMVDRAGAGYPFELMAERVVDGFRPLAEERGILRQFETEIFRSHPEMATRDQIFIVGNPKTILWANLPKAELEADEVARVAQEAHLTVVRAPRDNPESTIVQLVTGEHRIMHIAAHGVFDPDPMKSGVVVGDRLLITPAEVAAMPRVPELVFLNACYLGDMGAARSGAPDPRLAASLSEGFIKAGVRAVIAAGWAVDDEAGRTFAKEFYEAFLQGVPFGDAVKHARVRTRDRHPKANTWGAYQCYGNADYSFRQVDRPQGRGFAPVIVARSEALQALRTMVGDARRVSLGNVGALRRQFEALEDALGERWLDGEILHACGEICGELGDFDKAIAFYERSVKCEPAQAPLLAAEQLANLLVRAAARPNGSPDAAEKRARAFDRALALLNWLDSEIGESTERSALRGSLFKRRAVWEPDERRQHIQRALRAYARARRLSRKASYGSLNAFAMRFVVASPRRLRSLRREIDVYHAQLTNNPGAGPRDFWQFVEAGDGLLLRNVVHHSLDEPMVVDNVVSAFEHARRIGPSPREWASVCDQIAFLATMTRDQRLPCANAATAAALEKISAALGIPVAADAPQTA
jgi:CHAT domain-containing protein